MPLYGHFSNSVKINCRMPTHVLKRLFNYFGYEQEIRQAALPTFEGSVKFYLLVQYNTKQERGDQQPSIAEKSSAQLAARKQAFSSKKLYFLKLWPSIGGGRH